MIFPAVMKRVKSLGPVIKAARDDSNLIGGSRLAQSLMVKFSAAAAHDVNNSCMYEE
jgi:hypothetical protein